MTRLAYAISEVAAALGVSRRTVDRMIARGELRTRRTTEGGRILIPADELDLWLVGERRAESVSPRRRKAK